MADMAWSFLIFTRNHKVLDLRKQKREWDASWETHFGSQSSTRCSCCCLLGRAEALPVPLCRRRAKIFCLDGAHELAMILLLLMSTESMRC